MTHFGLTSPDAAGHLNPTLSLARELLRRGHQVTYFGMQGTEVVVVPQGIDGEFCPHPAPHEFASIPRKDLEGYWGFHARVVPLVMKTQVAMAEWAPSRMKLRGIDVLIADQLSFSGRTLAELLKVPLVTVCTSIPLNFGPRRPPAWADLASVDRARNVALGAVEARWWSRHLRPLNAVRQQWGLPPQTDPCETGAVLTLVQLPQGFDWPPPARADFQYVGPLFSAYKHSIPWPREELTGQPLVYVTLGTVFNVEPGLLALLAETCQSLDVQLLVSLGRGDMAPMRLPGQPMVLPFVPQNEVLEKASLMITRGGVNTVLDGLQHGVPMVVLPVGADQPGMAQRLVAQGAGRMLKPGHRSVSGLRSVIVDVLKTPTYRQHTVRGQASIQRSGGVVRAVDLLLGVGT